MARACFIADEFAEVRLLSHPTGRDEAWRPNSPTRGGALPGTEETAGVGGLGAGAEEPQDAIWWKAQAALAADWVVSKLEGDKRLASVCLDIGDASCVWLAAPSAQRRVIAAALRQEGAEWTDLEPGGLIEPLAAPSDTATSKLWEFSAFGIGAKRGAAPAAAVRLPVMLAPDALPRLFLDELDRRGVRVGVVTSLWHAACAAWLTTEAAALGAVILAEESRLVWAWGRGGLLRAAGRLETSRLAELVSDDDQPPPSEPAEARPQDVEAVRARLSLDWLTWAAQLGEAPKTILVVGRNAAALADALKQSLPGAECRAVDEPDPIAATARAAVSAPGAGAQGAAPLDDPRAELVTLTRRRGRAHQRLYTWTGAALAVLAMGVGALGWRFRAERAALKDAAAELLVEQKLKVKDVAPDLASNDNPLMALESRLAEVRKKGRDFKDPLPARPILDELARLTAIMAEMGPRGVKLDEISLHEVVPAAHITAPDFATGEEFTAKLKAAGGAIRWKVEYEGNAGGENLKYRLTGEWTKEGA